MEAPKVEPLPLPTSPRERTLYTQIADIFTRTSPLVIGGFAGNILHSLAFQQPYKVLAPDPTGLGAVIRDEIVDKRNNLYPKWVKAVDEWGPKVHGGKQADVMYRFLIHLAVNSLLTK